MNRTEDNLFPPRASGRLRIYAYAIDDAAHEGWLKVGQTTKDVKIRVGQQLKTAAINNYRILVDESAERPDGSVFTDRQIRERLLSKGCANPEGEWVVCTVDDVLTAITELRVDATFTGTHHQTFSLRPEQEDAVERTRAYFDSIWAENAEAVPHFLWNAKMRFGKTFATYQLAKRMGATRILVATFKPVVADSWRQDLESHIDFDGWRYFSRENPIDAAGLADPGPLVYFGSFQDLLGRDRAGNIKARNTWVHEINWDLVVLDEYHFGAWRERAKELFEGEDEREVLKEVEAEYGSELASLNEGLEELGENETDVLPITTHAYLYLSGTPFKALARGEFIEEQIFNWTYTDEQRAKHRWSQTHPDTPNPYGALPEMRLLTYQMPDELIAIARQGEFDEFDLNEFFAASGSGTEAEFKHKSEVQKWLDIITGASPATQIDHLRAGATPPPFPYSDVRLRPHLNHSFWFLPSVASCNAMANLLREPQNTFFHAYEVLTVAGPGAGVGLASLPPVRAAIGIGHDTKTITLSCAKLTTGVTVREWSSILMLKNLNAPETYFQAAFRVQSPWSLMNPDGDDPNREEVYKEVCYVFDFAPTRALRQISEYAFGLAPESPDREGAVQELVSFLPVLAFNGSHMIQIDAGGILDIAMAGTSATLLARKWESALLVNVDNDTLRRLMGNQEAMDAIMNIEGFRALGANVFQAIINESDAVRATKKDKGDQITEAEKRQMTDAEKAYKAKRKQIQEKLIKFATRIPAFMYLTDFRENTLRDVITRLEPDLFKKVTGLSVEDFNVLVSLGVFNSTLMDEAVFAFRRYEEASLRYTGVDSHPDLRVWGLYDTVVAAREE